MAYRNRQLLDLTHEAPCCLQLGVPGCGKDPSVPAHSDMIRHGRGVGHKSHDCFAVPGCPVCHDQFKRSLLGKDGYLEAWLAAMERYTLWLWLSDRIRIVTKQAPKETSMEAPHCKICDKRHWAREPHQLPANAPAEVRSKNTRREGRDVLKGAKPTSTASTERPNPPPATPGTPAGKNGQSRAAKPSPGKRKPRTQIIATYTPPAQAKKKGKKK